MIQRLRQIEVGPLGFFVLLFGPIAASAIFLVWTRVTTLRLGYELAETQSQLQRIVKENETLRASVSALESSGRLRALAKDEFGLERPRAEQIARAEAER